MGPDAHMLVIDGSYALHRAFHALSTARLKGPDGQPVWALHGFCTSLAKLIAMRTPTHLLVALDAPGGCPSRRALLPGYKQGRTPPPAALTDQLAALPTLLARAGIPTQAHVGWEADDVIASTAAHATAVGARCSIFTADRDVYQLLNETTNVVRLDGTDIDVAALAARYNVRADQYLDLAAMRGEVSDAIEGVPGVGEKTAAKVLGSFDSFADAVAVPEQLEAVVGPRLAGLLVQHAERVERNREVARLNRTLTIDTTVCALPLDAQRITDALRAAYLPAAASALASACGRVTRTPH